MPPESVPGIGDNPGHIDPFPADMWCLGETIFYLLTQKRTFGGDLIRLRQYWKGSPFPKEPLLHVRASDAAIGFVQELMAPLPAQRLTAEMADQHELIKMEPFQEVERETRETLEGREYPPTMIPEEIASGRWTTAASHHQSLGIPSDSWDTTMVEDLAGQIPSSPRHTWFASHDTGPPASVQGPEHGTNTSTKKVIDGISPLDQLKLEAQARFDGPVVARREAMGYEPQGDDSQGEPPPSDIQDESGPVIIGLDGINPSSRESSRPSSTRAERGSYHIPKRRSLYASAPVEPAELVKALERYERKSGIASRIRSLFRNPR